MVAKIPDDITVPVLRDLYLAEVGTPGYTRKKIWEKNRLATPRYFEFQRLGLGRIPDIVQHPSGKVRDFGPVPRPDKYKRPLASPPGYDTEDGTVGVTPDGLLLNTRQVKRRAKRKAEKQKQLDKDFVDYAMMTPRQRKKVKEKLYKRAEELREGKIISEQEKEVLFRPLEEWDLEELARGRPRDRRGGWAGKPPSWVTKEIFEGAMERFEEAMKLELHAEAIPAMDAIRFLLRNNEIDAKGRPVIAPNVKLNASQFVMEHLLGKPQQRVQQDISVKLQGILGAVMVNPADFDGNSTTGELPGPAQYELAHRPGETLALRDTSDQDDQDIVDADLAEDYSEFYTEE